MEIYNKEITTVEVYKAETGNVTTPKYFKIEKFVRVTYAETQEALEKGINLAQREYPEGTDILKLDDHKGAKLVV